jgi:two-component system OmpR family response regulator
MGTSKIPKSVKPHLLIIDDDEAIRELLGSAFIEVECRVSLAPDAVVARQILDTDIPDVCLIDALLTGEAGLSIAAYAAMLGLPVLMMTGDAVLADEMDDALRANIRKPFGLAAVVDKVAETLDKAIMPGSGAGGEARSGRGRGTKVDDLTAWAIRGT